MDQLKKVIESFVSGFMMAVYVWAAFILLNAALGLFGLTVALALPEALAFVVKPFVMGPILGLIKVLFDYFKG